MSDDSDGFGFLTSVSSVELELANKTFNDGAECFSELLGLVSSSSVGYEDLSFNRLGSDIINKAGVFNLIYWRGTLISSYDHFEKSLGAFSKVILEVCS